ncbi:MAG TPA: carotenoid biosynthesis protein [Thermomicrobiales bacterium]|jgi:putative membrane protein|nr:carotenoid biosynthesis protein [Thermomicrobiales bacterium]
MSTAEGHLASAQDRTMPAVADQAEDPGPIPLWGSFRPLSAKIAWGAFVGHLMAMTFGMLGILYVIPNLEDFVTSPDALRVYNWGMEYGGASHMILGAVAVFALGVYVLGLRKTTLFFVLAYLISAASELVGTSTGWPFGNYEYTSFLGYRLVDHVPYTIPLSWFYMGLTSYFLARLCVWLVGHRLTKKGREVTTILLGAWFVVVWDLVLDPAMAHEDLVIQFWTWQVDGAYFGMPIQNYIGWAFTAILFTALSRLSWNGGIVPSRIPAMLPILLYASNIFFASGLSLSVGLWIPIVLCVALVILPFAIAWLMRRANPPTTARIDHTTTAPRPAGQVAD